MLSHADEPMSIYCYGREKGWSPNAAHPDSQFVVLVRVHDGLPYPPDLLLHLRALMEEVSEVGMHFWLLYQEVWQEPC